MKAQQAPNALIDKSTELDVPSGIIFYGPSNFKNGLQTFKNIPQLHCTILSAEQWGSRTTWKGALLTLRAVLSELQLPKEEWPDFLPFVQSALNNAPSPQREGVPSITAFPVRDTSPPIGTFLRSLKLKTISVEKLVLERAFNIEALQDRCAEMHLISKDALRKNLSKYHKTASSDFLAYFTEGETVPVTREDLHEKHSTPAGMVHVE